MKNETIVELIDLLQQNRDALQPDKPGDLFTLYKCVVRQNIILVEILRSLNAINLPKDSNKNPLPQ